MNKVRIQGARLSRFLLLAMPFALIPFALQNSVVFSSGIAAEGSPASGLAKAQSTAVHNSRHTRFQKLSSASSHKRHASYPSKLRSLLNTASDGVGDLDSDALAKPSPHVDFSSKRVRANGSRYTSIIQSASSHGCPAIRAPPAAVG